MDDRRVQTLFSTIIRVSDDLNGQAVANTLWALATLGWQAAEGAMRAALEGAAVRVAPSMNAQDVANALWALWETEIRTARPPRGLSWAALAKQVLANWQTYR
jgi:hypothetical protein